MSEHASDSGERNAVRNINFASISQALLIASVLGLFGWIMRISSAVDINTVQVVELKQKSAVLEVDSRAKDTILAQRGERLSKLESEQSGLQRTVERIERTLDKIAEKVGVK